MRIVRLPFKDGTQADETHRGVVISRWLKDQGLKMGSDYTWMVSTKDRELHFMFNGNTESWATMLTMKEL